MTKYKNFGLHYDWQEAVHWKAQPHAILQHYDIILIH